MYNYFSCFSTLHFVTIQVRQADLSVDVLMKEITPNIWIGPPRVSTVTITVQLFLNLRVQIECFHADTCIVPIQYTQYTVHAITIIIHQFCMCMYNTYMCYGDWNMLCTIINRMHSYYWGLIMVRVWDVIGCCSKLLIRIVNMRQLSQVAVYGGMDQGVYRYPVKQTVLLQWVQQYMYYIGYSLHIHCTTCIWQ